MGASPIASDELQHMSSPHTTLPLSPFFLDGYKKEEEEENKPIDESKLREGKLEGKLAVTEGRKEGIDVRAAVQAP